VGKRLTWLLSPERLSLCLGVDWHATNRQTEWWPNISLVNFIDKTFFETRERPLWLVQPLSRSKYLTILRDGGRIRVSAD